MATTRQALTISGISLVTLGLTYCFYFDYKRRNDPVFRRKLLKEQRRFAKHKQTQGKDNSREAEQMLAAAVEAINSERLPTTPDEKETYFMEQVGMGEMLSSRMPQGAVPAAIAFFKAYKVYPSPQDLLRIYQNTMPPEVFAILVEMIKLDVRHTPRVSKPSSSNNPSRLASSEGPVIEEITGEERALLNALRPDAASVPSISTNPPETEPAQSNDTTSSRTNPAPLADPSAPPSENGSLTAGSQAGNSFVLVEDEEEAAIVTVIDEEPKQETTDEPQVEPETVTEELSEQIVSPDHSENKEPPTAA